jgi:N-acetyl-gamma-glutamyl-phosphate reductase
LPELNKAILEMPNTLQIRDVCHCDTIGFITACSKGLLKTDVHINATTGSTGAGVSPSETTHFSWRSNNMSHYKAFDHQ